MIIDDENDKLIMVTELIFVLSISMAKSIKVRKLSKTILLVFVSLAVGLEEYRFT